MRGVRLAAPGHADVQGPAGKCVGDQQVRGIHGAALRHVHVPGIREFRGGLQVGAGHLERRRPGGVLPLAAYCDLGPADGCDLQRVPVGEALASGVDIDVQPGTYQVTDPGMVPVRQVGLASPDLAELGKPGLHPPGQLGGFRVRPRQQENILALQMVGQPGARSALVGGFLVAAPDPAAGVIRGDRGEIPGPQPHRRVRFPVRIESPDLVEFGGGNLLREQLEHAPGFG